MKVNIMLHVSNIMFYSMVLLNSKAPVAKT